MDLQFYGANCITLTYKGTRVVIDDNLAALGGKSIIKNDDIVVFTNDHADVNVTPKLLIDQPGEYELSDFTIKGIAAQSHLDDSTKKFATMYRVSVADIDVLIVGHIYPDVTNTQLETIGSIDVMLVPVGGNGYTLDATGALKIIKGVEPKLVIPTHYADSSLNFEVPQTELAVALKDLAMEPKETISKLRLKPTDITDGIQLVILEKS